MTRMIHLALFSSVLAAQNWQAAGPNLEAERQEWFYSQRTYPLGYIPAGARIEVIRELARRSSTKPRTASSKPPAWTLIGPRPTNAGPSYITAGRVNAIAVDPRDNNVVYIGAAGGGVWKTSDGGANWTPLTDNQASLASGAIALDPQNPDTVYVGTGEENFAIDSYYGAGVLKSTDGGATWTNIVGPFLRDTISTIAVSPSDGNVVICAAASGVWRSADGAATWARVLSGAPATSLVFDPGNGSSVYSALGSLFGSTNNGIYHSTDGGVTWLPLSGIPSGTSALPGRIQLAMAPSQPSTIYAQIQSTSFTGFGTLLGIWKTTDGGSTWNALTIPTSSLWGNQMWFDNALAVSPSDPNLIYSGGTPIFRSTDGGASWTIVPQAGPNGTLIHVDQHIFVFTPDGTRLYIGNDGGAYSLDTTSTSVNWTNLNATLAITELYPGLSVSPDSTLTLGGSQDNGTQRYNGDLSWTDVACGDGGFTAIDPSSPLLAFSSCSGIALRRTLRSDKDASGWIVASYGIDQTDAAQFISPFVMDDSNPQTLYFGTYRLWRTQDSAGRWRVVSPDLTGGRRGTLKTIAVAPSDSNTVYVGTSNGKVQVTTDMQDGINSDWTDVGAGLPARTVTHIAVDPVDSATAYVTFSGFVIGSAPAGHVFKTGDGGATWTDISGDLPDLPVNDLAIDPDLSGTLYIATDAGVMITADGGASWTALGDGLPKVVVTSLAFSRQARLLRAGTHGRSVWELKIPLISASAQPVITSISPASAGAGGPDMQLSVKGMGFKPSTVILWNGQPRTTSMGSDGTLSVQIPAGDTALAGRAVITAFNAAPGGGSSNAVPFNIGAPPFTVSSAFVSLANPLGGSALGQRSLASLYGTNLAAQPAQADLPPPLPFTLGGTTMTIDGNEVPLLYVSPGQVNFQVPFLSLSVPTQVPLVLWQGTRSVTVSVTVQPYSPAIFTVDGTGSGQARAIIANSNATAAPPGTVPPSRAAHIGEYISIYCTGLGDVTPRPGLGSASPANPLAKTLLQPVVMIGGVPASDIEFSGLAPGYVGVYMVNAQIAPLTPTGDTVPVTIKIAGFTSNTATIAVDDSQ